MRNFIFISLFILFALAVNAQIVRNVKATQEGQKIAISYELECTQPTEINLFLSEDNGQTWNALRTGVSGDVGVKVTQGNKVIYWDVLQSKEKLVGNAFVFKVKVKEESKEIKSVKIGDQMWMAKNLDVDHYANGELIYEVRKSSEWSSMEFGAWCNFENDVLNDALFGKLYNWWAVSDSRGLCPSGWHVASVDEWIAMEEYLGGTENVGKVIKSINFTNGKKLISSDTPSFNAVAGGYRGNAGSFEDKGEYALWWTASEINRNQAVSKGIYSEEDELTAGEYDKKGGFSVRCVKD